MEIDNCTCSSEKEHAQLLKVVEDSFKQDFDRNSERRRSAPTSESIRAKVANHLAGTNGHTGHTVRT